MHLLLALVVSALLAHLIFAIAPLPRPHFSISRSIVHSNAAQCPCSVHVHRSRSSRSSSVPIKAFDLLAIRKEDWDKKPSFDPIDEFSIRFVQRYSSMNISVSSAVSSDAFFEQFEERKIEDEGEFVVAIRSSNGALIHPSEYLVHLRPLDRENKSCPVMLGPDPPSTGKNLITETSRSIHGDQVPEPRIVGGDFASPNLAPYMVVIYHPGPKFCSGALLSSRWVVTAAHCAVNKNYTVGLQTTQAYKNGVTVNISRVFTHPKYGSTGIPRQHDITVIELAEPAPAGSKFMMLNGDVSKPKEGEYARVAGYGTISYLNVLIDKQPRALRQVDVPIANFSRCLESYKPWEPLSKKKQACAGYFEDGGCDACSGDSGGPLMQYTSEGIPILVGLTSYGLGCALANFPGVYARIAAFIPWLRTTPAVFTVAPNTSSSNPTTSSSPTAKPLPSKKPSPMKPGQQSTPTSEQPRPDPEAVPTRLPTPPQKPMLTPTPRVSQKVTPNATVTTSQNVPQAVQPAIPTPQPSKQPQRIPTPNPSGPYGPHGPCQPGWKLKKGRCVVCYKHAVSPGGFVTSCTQCPPGATRDNQNGSKCKCEAGRGLDGDRCVLCRPGWFSSEQGQTCQRCIKGSFTSQYGSTQCKPCPAGEVPTKDQKKCRECRGMSECNDAKATN